MAQIPHAIRTWVAAQIEENSAAGEQILRNSAFQVCAGLSPVTKMNTQSTGTVGGITVTGWSGTGTLTFTTADTGQLKNDDLVKFSGAGVPAAVTAHSLRVSSVIANTSFVATLSLGRTEAFAGSPVALPQTVGDYTGSTGDGPDYWKKTTAADLWIEDGTVNLLTGTKRVVGLRKTISGQQSFWYQMLAADIVKYRGKRVSFGMWVYHKIQGGSGTFRLSINDGVSAVSYSSSGASTGAWEHVRLQNVLISNTASLLYFGISMDGNSTDVYFVGQPYGIEGAQIPENHYKPIEGERLIPIVQITPTSWSNAAVTFPAAADADSTYSFTFDIYQENEGKIAPDVKSLGLMVEGTNGNAVVVGSGSVRLIAFKDKIAAPQRVGPICSQQVLSVKSFAYGQCVLSDTGTAVCHSIVSADSWSNCSIDVENLILN